jgi:hypothetical protein
MNLTLSYGVAILIRCVSVALIALGVVLQRKSHIVNDNLPENKQKNALKRPLWQVGFWMYVISSVIGDLVGISSLPILVIAPLTTLVLFFNAAYSKYILKERMTYLGWLGTIIIAIASIAFAVLLNVPTHLRDGTEIHKLLVRPGYIVYCVVNLIVLCICFLFIYYCKHKQKQLFKISRSELHIINGEIIEHSNVNEHTLNRLNFWCAILFQLVSTILAAQALVFAKLFFDLFQKSSNDKTQFISSMTIGILIVTIITTILQLIFFNASLHYYSTLVTVPFGYSLGIILACLNTIVYYDFFSVLQAWKIIIIIISMIATIFGIYLLSK